MQTSEQLAAFRALCAENGLTDADTWQHKQSGNWIMSKMGAEKMQGRNNIDIDMEVCEAGIDFAIVKVTATRTVKVEGKATAKKLTARTLGSASPKNCTQISYYAEMAEKRATVRAVLKLMGFSKLGVYGEEEAEDFARTSNHAGPSRDEANAAGTTVRPTQPAAPLPAPAPPASLPPVRSAGAAPTEPHDDAFLFMQVATALDAINEAETLEGLAQVWAGLDRQVKEELDVYDAKESRKAHLQANQTLSHAR